MVYSRARMLDTFDRDKLDCERASRFAAMIDHVAGVESRRKSRKSE